MATYTFVYTNPVTSATQTGSTNVIVSGEKFYATFTGTGEANDSNLTMSVSWGVSPSSVRGDFPLSDQPGRSLLGPPHDVNEIMENMNVIMPGPVGLEVEALVDRMKAYRRGISPF